LQGGGKKKKKGALIKRLKKQLDKLVLPYNERGEKKEKGRFSINWFRTMKRGHTKGSGATERGGIRKKWRNSLVKNPDLFDQGKRERGRKHLRVLGENRGRKKKECFLGD